MAGKAESILSLEQQLAAVETNALEDERWHARQNYANLQKEYDDIVVPYPEVGPFDVAPLGDVHDLMEKKYWNEKAWAQQKALQPYINNPRLYCGHLQTAAGNHYFFTEKEPSRPFQFPGNTVRLINTEDKDYNGIVSCWHFPADYHDAVYSRNVTMHDFQVSDVDVVLDRGNELFSDITDSYLRKALLRNKDKTGVQSIIQTIQQKQAEIRVFPADKSFIVQGCAGSGKTMVLLHRLRYLLYNREISSDDYMLLIPSHGFRSFIKDACEEFGIHYKNVLPAQSYYQMMMGRPHDENVQDISELVFDAKYLARVYSCDFIRDGYRQLFDAFAEQADLLTEMCEEFLNGEMENEGHRTEGEIEWIKRAALDNIRSLTSDIRASIAAPLNEFEDILTYREAIESAYEAAYKEFHLCLGKVEDIVISPDDERLVAHPSLLHMRHDIEVQTEKVKKASIFTAASHKKKLAVLEEQYAQLYREIESELKEADRRAYEEQKAKLNQMFGGVTLENVAEILDKVKQVEAQAIAGVVDLMKRLENLEKYIGEKYQEGIDLLNRMIEMSAGISQRSHWAVQRLEPSWQYFNTNIALGRSLLNYFINYMPPEHRDDNRARVRLFTNRSENQLEAYMSLLLFNRWSSLIKQEFNIIISNQYKHYWYLMLYSHYLTRRMPPRARKLLFIDEAQDLSSAELELIYRLNYHVEKDDGVPRLVGPRMNLFGDVGQMITEHGIKSWDEVHWVSERYELAENFRNTNQIVDFCNQHLPFHMQAVGVDMDAVLRYETIDDAKRGERRIKRDSVYIVKDEYAASDLKILLKARGAFYPTVYTVKEAKGLEFREVFVFDRGMSDNEKYIAYTRALATLTVIDELPWLSDHNVPLYVEGSGPVSEERLMAD